MASVFDSPRSAFAAPVSVLIVDDEDTVASVVARGLNYAGYQTQLALSGPEALDALATRASESDGQTFDVLLTDIHMPKMRGDELQRVARDLYPDLAVVLMSGANEASTAIECLKDGVYDYVTKPFDLSDLAARIEKAAERQQLVRENLDYQINLERKVAAQADKLKRTLQGALESLIQALETKDPHMRDHSKRVTHISTLLVDRLHPGDDALRSRVRAAALFHDIGTIGIPEAILVKDAPLTDAETVVVRRHPETGASILAPVLDTETIAIVRQHHERPDGLGYPAGISSESISPGAQILALAEAFDSMLSPRPYRAALSRDETLSVIRLGAGSQFDPAVVEACLALAAAGAFDKI